MLNNSGEISASAQPQQSRLEFKIIRIVAVLLALAMWGLAVALPVWETRSDTTGKWQMVQGALPALIGWLGILALNPAWYANLLLIPVCITLFKGRRVGFVLSVIVFCIAATAYMMPALYGDNETAVIVGRKIGFYLWLGSFGVLVLAHALPHAGAGGPSTLARLVGLAMLALAVLVLEHSFRVGVSPLEATLKYPDDVAELTAGLSSHPSQAEKDAALHWVMLSDVSSSRIGTFRSDRLEKLIVAGANVNQSDRYGNTPLREAVTARGAEPAVRLLIRAGADVNARDYRGKTVLDFADERGSSAECLKILTDAGAIRSSAGTSGNQKVPT